MFQFSSVAQSCLTLCDPMNCSMPGLPVHHQHPESTQTHVHWVGDAIQPSHPLSSPSPPALNLSQHQGLFKWVILCIRWPKNWSFSSNISPSNEHPGMFKGLLNKMEYVSLRSGQDYNCSLIRTYSLLWCSVRLPRYSQIVDSLVLQGNLWLKTWGRVRIQSGWAMQIL